MWIDDRLSLFQQGTDEVDLVLRTDPSSSSSFAISSAPPR